jgi:hypothetical protein
MGELWLALAALGAGVAFGTQWTVFSVVLPVIRERKADAAIELHRALLDHAAHEKTAVPAVSLIAMGVLLALVFGVPVASSRGALALVAIAGVVGISITTFGFNAPINRRVRGGAIGVERYAEAAETWARAHAWRTVSGGIAFVALLSALALS